jgi:hypothetical protein
VVVGVVDQNSTALFPGRSLDQWVS